MGITLAKNKLLSFSDPENVSGFFVAFPANDAEVAQKWGEFWFELVKDMITPSMASPPVVSQAAFMGAFTVPVPPGAGLVTMSTAALAAFPALALSIVPNLIAVPPPLPLLGLLTPAMAPFITGTTDPTGPAGALAGAFAAWVETAMWTIPAPPTPLPFKVAP